MPLTGLVFLVLGGVYAYFYATASEQAKREEVNTKVARYARFVFAAAGVILLLVAAFNEIF